MRKHKKRSRHIRGNKTGRGVGKRSRGAGNRGGRGMAGINKRGRHKKTLLIKYPGLSAAKKGFMSVKQKKGMRKNAINVEQAEALSAKLGNEIDLGKLGYDKLLGSGKIKKKLTIKISFFTESAKQKVENAGGKIISEQPESEGSKAEKTD